MNYIKAFLMSVVILSGLKEVSLKGMEYSVYGERYRIVYHLEQHGGHGNVPLCTDFSYIDQKFNQSPSQEKMVAESSCVNKSTLNNLMRLRNNHQMFVQTQVGNAAQREKITQAIILPNLVETNVIYTATPVNAPIVPMKKNTPPPVRHIRQ